MSPRALVLAAGEGRRLRPLTNRLAKPALPFVGLPILDRILEGLATAGVEEAVVNLHHAPASVRRVVAARGSRLPRVTFSDETAELLGTAGAVMPLRDWLADDDFLLVNGDCVHSVDQAALLEAHRRSGADATLAVQPRGAAGFGSLLVGDDGAITAFGAPTRGRPEERHYLSVQAVSPRMLRHLPDGPPRPLATFRDWFPAAASAGCRIVAWETDADWHAADSRERYLQATRSWLAARSLGPWLAVEADVDRTADIDAGCAVHSGCRVGARARLRGTVLLPGAVVDADAALTDCLVGPGAHVAAGQAHADALLT